MCFPGAARHIKRNRSEEAFLPTQVTIHLHETEVEIIMYQGEWITLSSQQPGRHFQSAPMASHSVLSVNLRGPGVAYARDTDLKAQEMTRSTQRVLFKGISRFRSAFPLVPGNGFQSEIYIRRR